MDLICNAPGGYKIDKPSFRTRSEGSDSYINLFENESYDGVSTERVRESCCSTTNLYAISDRQIRRVLAQKEELYTEVLDTHTYMCGDGPAM